MSRVVVAGQRGPEGSGSGLARLPGLASGCSMGVIALAVLLGVAAPRDALGGDLVERPVEELDPINVIGHRPRRVTLRPVTTGILFSLGMYARPPAIRYIRTNDEKDPDTNDTCDDSGSNGNGTSGNPVIVRTGNKVETEVDVAADGEMGLLLSRTYNRHWDGIGVFGRQWSSSLDYKLTFGTSAVNSCYPRPGGGTCGIGTNTVIWAHRPEGRLIKFVRNADGTFRQDGVGSMARINVNADGSFTLRDEDNSVERYSSAGYVQSVSSPSGIGWTFGYSGTYPTRVTHTSGRSMELVWSGGKVTSVRDLDRPDFPRHLRSHNPWQ